MSCTLYASDSSGNVYSLDCASGSAYLIDEWIAARIEELGLSGLSDIACHGNTLWGVSLDQLIRIDLRTADVTIIGDIGFSDVVALAVASTGIIYGGTISGEFLWIDPATGAGNGINTIGFGGFAGDMAFDCNDNLFASVNDKTLLVRIDVETGTAGAIGPINYKGVQGLAFYCCHLYGVTGSGLVMTINTYSGEGTPIGDDGIKFSGMTVCCCNCGC